MKSRKTKYIYAYISHLAFCNLNFSVPPSCILEKDAYQIFLKDLFMAMYVPLSFYVILSQHLEIYK